jgi:hypothetical protein
MNCAATVSVCRVTDDILAMARPSTETVKNKDIIGQFKR